MSIETIVREDIAQSTSLGTDAALDSRLAAAQFEAIIRAWKGEVTEGAVPTSPVGEVDWDGSLTVGQLGTDKIFACDSYSYFDTRNCSPGSTYNCTMPDQLTCPTSPYGNGCITLPDVTCLPG